jgi:hypothetical protein
MATQLGEIQLTSIENNTIKGIFKSVYEKNVYTAGKWFGVEMIKEGCYHKDIEHLPIAKITQDDIIEVIFETPNTVKTNFVVKVAPNIDLKDFEGGASDWDSYMLG